MSILSAMPILGGVMLLAISLAGCESKSKREFNAGCQSSGTARSTCSCVYDQLEAQYSPAVMEKLGDQNLSNFDLPQDFVENMALAAQYCQSR